MKRLPDVSSLKSNPNVSAFGHMLLKNSGWLAKGTIFLTKSTTILFLGHHWSKRSEEI